MKSLNYNYIFLLSFLLCFSILANINLNPVDAIPEGKPDNFYYTTWTHSGNASNNQDFLDFLDDGNISVVVINSAYCNNAETNNLYYSLSTSWVDSFKTNITATNPNRQLWADIYSWSGGGDYANYTTSTMRTNMANEFEDFIDYYGDRFDAIIDDTEYYLGTWQDKLDAFNTIQSSCITKGISYYAWVYWATNDDLNTYNSSIGMYDSHAYNETDWKSRFDFIANDTIPYGKDNYQIWIITESEPQYPTIAEQLSWFDDQIELNGWNYYSNITSIGIWWFPSMNNDDFQDWYDWIAEPEPTPTPTPTPTPDTPQDSVNVALSGMITVFVLSLLIVMLKKVKLDGIV